MTSFQASKPADELEQMLETHGAVVVVRQRGAPDGSTPPRRQLMTLSQVFQPDFYSQLISQKCPSQPSPFDFAASYPGAWGSSWPYPFPVPPQFMQPLAPMFQSSGGPWGSIPLEVTPGSGSPVAAAAAMAGWYGHPASKLSSPYPRPEDAPAVTTKQPSERGRADDTWGGRDDSGGRVIRRTAGRARKVKARLRALEPLCIQRPLGPRQCGIRVTTTTTASSTEETGEEEADEDALSIPSEDGGRNRSLRQRLIVSANVKPLYHERTATRADSDADVMPLVPTERRAPRRVLTVRTRDTKSTGSRRDRVRVIVRRTQSPIGATTDVGLRRSKGHAESIRA